MKYLTIKELPPDERPRERLQKCGAEALSDSELLAIILRTGTAKVSAMQLAAQLLGRFKSFRGIASASIEELCEIDGIGPAKAAQIKAAFEIGTRLSKVNDNDNNLIRSSKDVRDMVWHEMRMYDQEHFKIVLLNTKNRVIRIETVTVGILDSSIVHPREVFKSAIKSNAACVILVHNHPSGDSTPSRDDEAVTRRLYDAGELVGISVVDHIIIGEKSYYSFKDNNKI